MTAPVEPIPDEQAQVNFRALFDASPTPLLVIAPPDWTIVTVNEARLRITGTTREHQIGRRLFDVFPDDPDDPAADGLRKLDESLRRVMATKAPDTMAVQRYAVRDPSGRFVERWWAPVNTPVLDGRGEVAQIIHRVEEVTELVRMRGEAAARDKLAREQQAVIDRLRESQVALRSSEERFRRMADAVPQIVWITDRHGRMEFLNKQFGDYTGAAGEAWAHAEVGARFMHPEDGAQVAAAFEMALGTGDAFEIEHRIRSAAGDYRWFLARAVPFRDERTGEIDRWFGASVDIHDRKLAEERLRELNDTLETRVAERTAERDRMWQTSPDLLVVIDFEGVFQRVNPAWTTLLGYAPEELVGRHVNGFVLPDDHAATVAAYELAAKGGLPTIENRYRHRDGSVRWISWTAAPAGEVTYATGRDITAEKAKQAELEVAQEALRQSQKLEAVGQLTGGVAHDFNNLLTIIRSSSDLLRRPDLPEERRRRYVDAIADTVDRAAKLTGQLLAFARRQALKPEVFDVAERVRDVIDMLRTVVGARVRLVVHVDDGTCFTRADVSQFETALLNMAINARDAMDGEGTLTVSVHALSAIPPLRGHAGSSGAFVAVSVADSGSGIAPDRLAQVFEPFYTTKEVGKGTGLGLSQVYGFVKQSGGDVGVESAPGQGSTFTVYLPRVDAPADEAAGRQPEAGISAEGRGRRVLVVEDDVEVGRFSTQLLHDFGYVTTWAANAGEALALLDGVDGFDVVFSDVVMPGMSGVELGEEIRRRHPGLPVVLTSGYSHVLAEEGRHGFELLHKPYAAEELSRVLRRATRGQANR